MKISARLRRQLYWLNLPSSLLITLLQRTPALKVVTVAEEMVIASPLGAVLKSVFVGAASMGALHSMAGATVYTSSPGSPLNATVGTPISGVAIGIVGSLDGSDPDGYTITGALPPGLSFNGTTAGFAMGSTLFLNGTPTAAGSYAFSLKAHSPQWGDLSFALDYTIEVTGGVSNTAPAITTQPANQSVTAGASAAFTAAASGTPAPTLQWQRLPAGSGTWANVSNAGSYSGVTTGTLTVTGTTTGMSGDQFRCVATNSVNSATSSAATLTVNAATTAPAITAQPANQSVTAGASAAFTAAASGTPTPTLHWQRLPAGSGIWADVSNAGSYSGVTTGTLTVTGTTTGMSGDQFRCVATNSVSSATSSAASLTVSAANTAPAITTQPSSQTATVGANVTFTSAASGNPPPTYQWQKDGVNISGATNATLTLVAVQLGDAATYRVVATNSVSSATSNGAVLAVNAATSAPTFTTQPISRVVGAGTNVTFLVAASGTPAPTLQWEKGGTAIVGATNATLTINNVQAGDVATYTAVATNAAGVTTSNGATLALGTVPAGFDAAAYLARYPDIAAIYGTDLYGAWVYYRDFGIYSGEIFDDVFRVEEYLSLYPELLSVFGTNFSGALMHWLTQGRIEGRLGRIPLLFSEAGYYAHSLTDPTSPGPLPVAFATNRIMAWEHYWAYGIYEGRAFDDEFLAFHYYAMNPDLQAVFPNDWRGLTLHWLVNGRQEGRLGRVPLIFSSLQYGTRNPDVPPVWGSEPTTLWLHYYYYGVYELRNFDDEFRVFDYLDLNPDLQALFGTDYRAAMMHWVRYGRAEGRPGRRP